MYHANFFLSWSLFKHWDMRPEVVTSKEGWGGGATKDYTTWNDDPNSTYVKTFKN